MEKETTEKLRERIVKSFLDFLVLGELAKNLLMNADDLMDCIQRKFGVSPGLGIFYSNLYYLEKAGLIHYDFIIKKHARVRTVYRITSKGKEKIAIARKHKNMIQGLINRMFEG